MMQPVEEYEENGNYNDVRLIATLLFAFKDDTYAIKNIGKQGVHLLVVFIVRHRGVMIELNEGQPFITNTANSKDVIFNVIINPLLMEILNWSLLY
jgi:hypothetical protein